MKAVVYNKSTKLEIVAQLRAKSQHSELVFFMCQVKWGRKLMRKTLISRHQETLVSMYLLLHSLSYRKYSETFHSDLQPLHDVISLSHRLWN